MNSSFLMIVAAAAVLADPAAIWSRVGILVLLLGVVAGGGWLAYRRIARGRAKWDEDEGRSVPPLLMPLRPEGSRRITWEAAAPARSQAPVRSAASSPANGTRAAFADAALESEPVQAGPIRFHRPPDGTLQLLPGRLEILSGSVQEEIRFVKLSGRDPLITFGRSEGEPHAHIQLTAPTVSRLHASMRFHDGSWELRNLSGTNPAIVNGSPLGMNGAGARMLADGDTVEMGQVVFRFRSR